jgi:hypothetical protein
MGSKKTKSNSVQVTKPDNPAWVESGVSGLMDRSAQLGAGDPYQFVPAANAYQAEAAQGASKLSQSSAPQMQSTSLLDGLDKYMSPYRDDVVDAAMADFEADSGRTRAAQDLSLAGAGAFGGSGAALTKALTEGELSRARNTQLSSLLDQMFTRGASLSNNDADRRQAASLTNAQLEAGNRDQQLSALNLMGQRGDALRQVDYDRAQAPLNLATWQAAIQAGLPLSLFSGNTTTGNSTTKYGASLFENIQQGATTAAAVASLFPSDGRLKDDVHTLGFDDRGRRWVSFRYLWDEPGTQREGVIAQEIMQTDPNAVVEDDDGFLMVDYRKLHS